MRAQIARWAISIRLARRAAMQSWGRSLLVIALVAAPVTALVAAAVLIPSTQSTLEERVANELGHAQAKLTVVGVPSDGVKQGIEGGADYSVEGPVPGSSNAVDPHTVLPRTDRIITVGTAAGTFRTRTGAVSLAIQTGSTWDPTLNGGPYVLLSGRRPTAPDEILLSPAALSRLRVHVGSTVDLLQPAVRTFRVVGTERDRSLAFAAQTVFMNAAALPKNSSTPMAYYVPTAPIDWSTAQRLNAAGITAMSREVIQHPQSVPAAQHYGGGGAPNFAEVSIVVLALVFAALEVALLAGAAFAVGARLQQRTLATVAAVGADRSMLIRIVTASGVVLGTAGGLTGLVAGLLAAVLVMRLTDNGAWTRYPGLHLLWPVLLGIVLFGVLVGWLSALVPARAASRVDVVAALRGARPPQRVGRRPVAGLVVLLGGLGLTVLGAFALFAVLQSKAAPNVLTQFGALALLAGGPVLAQLGVVLCSGLLLRVIARALGSAPLSARMGARDISRNLGRSVPAAAAVMTTVFVAAFAMCIANTSSLYAASHYSWTTARAGEVQSLIMTADGKPASAGYASRWVATLRRDLPVSDAELLAFSPQSSDAAVPSGSAADAVPLVHFPSPGANCDERARLDTSDLRCGPFTANGGSGTNAQNWVTVGTPAALALLLGHDPSANALETLRTGGAVALRSDLNPQGRAALDWFTPKQLNGDPTTERPVRRTTLATVVDLPAHPIDSALFITPATAAALHIVSSPQRVLLTVTQSPSNDEIDSANSALGALANAPDNAPLVYFERGPQDFGSLIAWWILAACLVIAVSAGATAVGLARVDGRADDLTLTALGAARRLRRSVAWTQALIICGLGAITGSVLGLLPAAAIGAATSSYPFAPPPAQLLLTAVGIPVVIAAGSWLLVGKPGDLARRRAIA